MRRFLPSFLLATLLSSSPGNLPAASPFNWQQDTHQLRLTEDGTHILTFQLTPKSADGKYPRANYVHPLFDLDGAIVTEDFPKDHLHHRGIFWTWHQLLLDGKPVADPWNCRDIEWQSPVTTGDWVQTSSDEKRANMKVTRDWMVPDPGNRSQKLRVVRETVHITAHPSGNDQRMIDFDLRFQALIKGVSLGGSDDVKGYGGFSPRIRLADDVAFIGQKGPVKPENTAVDGGAWMDVMGTFDGKRSGVAILVHPSHPGFPLKWILRAKRSMQNPQWPGRDPAPLSTETEIRLRYRLVLHRGTLSPKRLETIWNQFARPNRTRGTN